MSKPVTCHHVDGCVESLVRANGITMDLTFGNIWTQTMGLSSGCERKFALFVVSKLRNDAKSFDKQMGKNRIELRQAATLPILDLLFEIIQITL